MALPVIDKVDAQLVKLLPTDVRNMYYVPEKGEPMKINWKNKAEVLTKRKESKKVRIESVCVEYSK